MKRPRAASTVTSSEKRTAEMNIFLERPSCSSLGITDRQTAPIVETGEQQEMVPPTLMQEIRTMGLMPVVAATATAMGYRIGSTENSAAT